MCGTTGAIRISADASYNGFKRDQITADNTSEHDTVIAAAMRHRLRAAATAFQPPCSDAKLSTASDGGGWASSDSGSGGTRSIGFGKRRLLRRRL